jgi:hypothetical protein
MLNQDKTRTSRTSPASSTVTISYAASRMKWPPVPGTIQDTRIIPDHGLETKWGGELTWKAEYRVNYSVAGRNSAVWADSGIREESETGIRLALPQSRSRVGAVEPQEARSVDRRLPICLPRGTLSCRTSAARASKCCRESRRESCWPDEHVRGHRRSNHHWFRARSLHPRPQSPEYRLHPLA